MPVYLGLQQSLFSAPEVVLDFPDLAPTGEESIADLPLSGASPQRIHQFFRQFLDSHQIDPDNDRFHQVVLHTYESALAAGADLQFADDCLDCFIRLELETV